MGLCGGNKNGTYFIDHPDKKFPMRTVNDYFRENKEMYKIMYDQITPSLRAKLSTVDETQLVIEDEMMDY
nr:MAG TPA: hypothetical protein [Caudoviricetes sp.]